MTTSMMARRAAALYSALFARRPVTGASAPGRVNLLGEHTDYNGGPVLPLAVERCTSVVVGPGERWEAASARDGIADRFESDDAPTGTWTDYLAGVVRVLRRRRAAPPGATIAVASSVPIGAGLASSAALSVAAVKALSVMAGRKLTTPEIAECAYLAEHDEVGVHCGRMDQTIAARARRGTAFLIETCDGSMQEIAFPGRVWVLETGVERRLTDGRLNQRRRECVQAMEFLRDHRRDCHSLADLAVEELPSAVRILPPPLMSRVRHIVTESARTREAARALRSGDLPRLGRLMSEGHASLRDDYDSSCAEADALVELALTSGAHGARLVGAGWGGAVIALAPPAREARMLVEVAEGFERRFGRMPVMWATRAAGGLRREPASDQINRGRPTRHA